MSRVLSEKPILYSMYVCNIRSDMLFSFVTFDHVVFSSICEQIAPASQICYAHVLTCKAAQATAPSQSFSLLPSELNVSFLHGVKGHKRNLGSRHAVKIALFLLP